MASKWTDKRPTDEGFYWYVDANYFHDPERNHPTIIQLRNVQKGHYNVPPSWHIDFLTNDLNLSKSDKADNHNGCWLGPIPVPPYSGC